MLKVRIFFGTVAAMMVGVAAHAGVGSTGGGVSHVCRDDLGRIKFAEFLDLYEAKEMNRKLWPSTGTLEGDYLKSAQNTYRLQGYESAFDSDEVKGSLRNFLSGIDFLSPGEHLPWLGDVGNTIAPLPLPGCKFEQVAIFHDVGERISIDAEIWYAMSPQNQAALVTHELFYKLGRTLEEKTSENARLAVGLIYEADGMVSISSGIPANHMECYGGSGEWSSPRNISSFSIYPSIAKNRENKGLILQFNQIMGLPLLSKAVSLPVDQSEWDIGNRSDSFDDLLINHMVVLEPGANKKFRTPLEGEQTKEWELEIEYVYQKPIQLTLFKKGVRAQSTFVHSCRKVLSKMK